MTQSQNFSNDAARLGLVEVLLESIFKREAATVQMILASLYDIGSRDFIEHKVHQPVLKPILTPVASASRPIVRSLGNLWFQKNGPRLIAEWLYSQVKTKQEPAVDVQVSDVMALPEDIQKQLLYSQLNVKKLESTLQLRTRIFSSILGILMLWISVEHFF